MPPRASTLRFPDGILKRAGVVSLQSKQEVVAEARRSLHPVKVAWVNVGDTESLLAGQARLLRGGYGT